MKKSLLPISTSALILAMFLAACGNIATPAAIPIATETAMPTHTIPATVTPTPDLCAPENVRAEVDKVHRHMREFDDASTLAASMPREQLSGSIAELQKIRRAAEDEAVPVCLSTLKDYQLKHMNSVIATLIAFMSIGDPLSIDCASAEQSAETEAICENIAFARQQHDQYTLELARILEIPIITATAAVTPEETPTP